jgi:hypothetical protein
MGAGKNEAAGALGGGPNRADIEGVGAYQGEILNKTDIQERYRAKVKAAKTDSSVMGSQDWSGMEAIIESLRDVLSA